MNLHVSILQYRADLKAAWRDELTAKYQDPRNKLAAATLRQLASASDEDVSSKNKTALASITGPRLVKAADEIAREVAFRCFPADLNDFVALVLQRLADADAPPAGATLANVLPAAVVV